MSDSPDNLVEARRQIVSMCRKLETALQTLRDKAAEGRRLKPQITLAERRIQALQVALRCLDDAIRQGEGGPPLLRFRRHREGMEDEKRDALVASNNEVEGVAGDKVNGEEGGDGRIGLGRYGVVPRPEQGCFCPKATETADNENPENLKIFTGFRG